MNTHRRSLQFCFSFDLCWQNPDIVFGTHIHTDSVLLCHVWLIITTSLDSYRLVHNRSNTYLQQKKDKHWNSQVTRNVKRWNFLGSLKFRNTFFFLHHNLKSALTIKNKRFVTFKKIYANFNLVILYYSYFLVSFQFIIKIRFRNIVFVL